MTTDVTLDKTVNLAPGANTLSIRSIFYNRANGTFTVYVSQGSQELSATTAALDAPTQAAIKALLEAAIGAKVGAVATVT